MCQFAPTCSCPKPNSRWHFHCLVFPSSVCTSLSLTTLSASKSSSPLCLAFSLSLPLFLPSFLPLVGWKHSVPSTNCWVSSHSGTCPSNTPPGLTPLSTQRCGYVVTHLSKNICSPLPLLQQVEGGECITGRRRQKKKKKSPRPFCTVNAVSVRLLHLSASAFSLQQNNKLEKKRHEQLIRRRRFIFSHLEYKYATAECECLVYNPEEGIHVGALK